MASVLADVIDDVICAHCGAAVVLEERAVRCTAGHSFDVARQGYVSMLAGRGASTGDTAEMVRARERFLGAGHYVCLADAVVAAAALAGPGCVVDVGAGTGYYLERVLSALPDRRGIALDSSAAALRAVARCHTRAGGIACDVWSGLPVRTGAAALMLNVFAPRNGVEMRRALSPQGALVVATPTAVHLRELVVELGLVRVDAEKERRIEEALGRWFRAAAATVVEWEMSLGHAEVADLVAMGPSAHHVAPDLALLPEPVVVTASVRVATYLPRP
ncbi:MAG TPA: 23S rRNA methyltransferase [Actinomycetota bacterium]|nr:23S rRNA methyltransferase [Actinomycetota bacterium]